MPSVEVESITPFLKQLKKHIFKEVVNLKYIDYLDALDFFLNDHECILTIAGGLGCQAP